ncbi:TIGR00730 family Rossman fold protein [Formicincola oecophyllae]|uniref:Cytokinin riboside 5'-monophosphate phosphoribohydrolase n=1 Tax=Formicincola oecophyllae TaxID=2558361 RepID=A0A4Y6U7K3_9PROT|nr:TIGR00730 family Rossman fold protein [Formicincola oecophyllae]QDH13302.1 TIGR00730 family Rossman fold protein [Formicincola oecophyllae]
MDIKSIAVFCGSRRGNNPAYAEAAQELGTALGQAGLTLIYGGGKMGLMGVVASAVLEGGGHVKGVIPEFLTHTEGMHEDVTDLTVTEDMPSRKAELFTLPDAYVVLPGGMGTLDEFAEVLVNRQLHQCAKPIWLLDTAGWATPLLSAFKAMTEQGFADDTAKLFTVMKSVPALMAAIKEA